MSSLSFKQSTSGCVLRSTDLPYKKIHGNMLLAYRWRQEALREIFVAGNKETVFFIRRLLSIHVVYVDMSHVIYVT